MANRPKLTIEDQVAYMKNKGITFDHCSEKDAVRFLQESTYFFKVKAFDKNYIAHPKTGHYYNLDFSYLMELSTLDIGAFNLRYALAKAYFTRNFRY